jgi:hypothetical protein
MSQMSQLFIISPIPGDIDNKAEVFVIAGIDCPDCKGKGHHTYCEGKHGSSRDDITISNCPRCGGIGKLTAKVVVKWEPEFK